MTSADHGAGLATGTQTLLGVPVQEQQRRLEAVRRLLDENECDALLVYANGWAPGGVIYLTGWATQTQAWCVVTPTRCDLVTDRDVNLYTHGDTWLARENVNLIGRDGDIPARLLELLGPDVRRIALSGGDHVPASSMQRLATLGNKIVLDAIDLAGLRSVKAPVEIKLMTEVCSMADAAAECFREVAIPGTDEATIAGAIENAMRRAGASQFPRSTAVGTGIRTLDEYMFPTRRQVEVGDLVYMDCGARAFGYSSDITRTVVAGRDPTNAQLRILETVNRMYESAVASLKPGVDGRHVFRTAAEIAASEGFGLQHIIGHGVGCDATEYPILRDGAIDVPLMAGMVVTIEPGLYVEGVGGARLESMFLIENDGPKAMNHAPTVMWSRRAT